MKTQFLTVASAYCKNCMRMSFVGTCYCETCVQNYRVKIGQNEAEKEFLKSTIETLMKENHDLKTENLHLRQGKLWGSA